MPVPVKLLSAIDFTAGLNLRSDAFQLGDTESPDLLNIDLDPRGGFALRGAVAALNSTALNGVAHSLHHYYTAGGTEQVLVGVGKTTLWGTGANFTDSGVLWTVSTAQRSTEFNERLYFQNGTDAAKYWNGTTFSSALGVTFNDDLAAPNDGDMPIAKHICTHIGSVWVANTLESATNYRNRVRWSHPNHAEDWRTNDYIDIDTGHDGDQITALVPWNDRLLVFKNRSVHIITGFDTDTFQVFPLAQTAGAISQDAVAVTENGVYWFSWPHGVFFYDGKSVQWLWERLVPAIQDSSIPAAYQSGITLGWLNRRLWVSVPWEASTTNDRVFVYDPTLGRQGGWTFYDLAVGPMMEWRRSSSAALQLACTADTTYRVLKVDQDTATDSWHSDYLNVTGASGSYAWAADSAGTSVTGDLDLRVVVAATDYTPASTQSLLAKFETTGNQRSYDFNIETGGTLNLTWSADGSATISKSSTAATALTDGAKKWLRVTLDVDNGAAGNDVKFYMSDDGVNWTQLGSTVTTASTTAIFNSTARTTVGARLNDGSAQRFIGKVYSAIVKNGIAGTSVASPDFTAQEETTASFADTQANTWTISAPATLVETNDENISSYYFTRWFDAGTPAVRKRWRRPDVVMDNDDEVTLTFSVFTDYDPSSPSRTFTLTNTPAGSASSLWGTMVWGTDPWGADTDGAQSVERGPNLGRARAVQLKVAGPSTSVKWSVNSVSFKYIPLRVR